MSAPSANSGPQQPTIRIHGSTVSLSADTEQGDVLYYTIDGRDPTPASTELPSDKKYIELGVGQFVIKAIAVRGGVGSAISSAFYNYAPRSLVVQPDSGEYELGVKVIIVTEHNEVRYTTDGQIPTSDAELYNGPIVLTNAGTVSITAAMFAGGVLVGEPVRKRYTIVDAAPEPPLITPVSGSYEIPLRINMEGRGTICYTLDGEEPTATSFTYSGPMVISSPSDIVLKACIITDKGKRSSVKTVNYEVVTSYKTGEEQRTTNVFPVDNVEFISEVEDPARSKAEEVMSFLLAASEIKEKKSAEVTRLKRMLSERREEYKDVLRKLEHLQKEMGLANDHRRQLEDQKSNHVCSMQADIANKLTQLQDEAHTLNKQEKSVNSQLEEALALHTKFSEEEGRVVHGTKELRNSLEDRYLKNKRTLIGFPDGLVEEVHSIQMVAAEQRNEIGLLKATLEAMKPKSQREFTGNTALLPNFTPARRLVELPSVEAVVPIPAGAMRKITTIHGNGIQALRTKHAVDVCVVDLGKNLALKVVGHSSGVHTCTEEIERILATK